MDLKEIKRLLEPELKKEIKEIFDVNIELLELNGNLIVKYVDDKDIKEEYKKDIAFFVKEKLSIFKREHGIDNKMVSIDIQNPPLLVLGDDGLDENGKKFSDVLRLSGKRYNLILNGVRAIAEMAQSERSVMFLALKKYNRETKAMAIAVMKINELILGEYPIPIFMDKKNIPLFKWVHDMMTGKEDDMSRVELFKKLLEVSDNLLDYLFLQIFKN